MFKHFYLLTLFSVALILNSFAQEGRQRSSDDFEYYMGANFVSPETLKSFPTTPEHRAFLPPSADLSRYFPEPGDQGKQGSCVGWAVGYAARAYYAFQAENLPRNTPSSIPSPAFIYNVIQTPDAECNGGSLFPDALNLLKQGALSLKDYPYRRNTCSPPSKSQREAAADFRIKGWRAVDLKKIDQVKAELAKNHPVLVGLLLNKDFARLRGSDVWHAGSPEPDSGGHAVTLVGYDDTTQTFKLINSWGKKWGDGGFGRLSYETFKHRAVEGYVMRMPETTPVPAPVPVPDNDSQPTPSVPAISGLECAKIEFHKTANGLRAAGFVGHLEDVGELARQLAGKVSEVDVEYRPWPQCETLLTLDEAVERQDTPRVSTAKQILTEGAPLVFDVSTAGFHGYLHIAYLQADGSVVHLKQSDPFSLKTLAPHTSFTLGDGSNGGAEFEVSGPFGNEMMVVISSKSPLFSEPRPQVEKDRVFLSALRKAILAKPNNQAADRTISAAYVALETKAR
ncbi:hypothetical protein IWQ49_003921 [Labrenzia sp. EL_126]|nr:hypothetical protein [Labrenzia sp. EL_126]